MKVRMGARLQNGQTIEVETEDQDLIGEGVDVGSMSMVAKYKRLAGTADLLVLSYVFRAGDISSDFFAQKRAAIMESMK